MVTRRIALSGFAKVERCGAVMMLFSFSSMLPMSTCFPRNLTPSIFKRAGCSFGASLRSLVWPSVAQRRIASYALAGLRSMTTDGGLPMTLAAILMIKRPEMSVIFRCDYAAACKRSISNCVVGARSPVCCIEPTVFSFAPRMRRSG
jgi:hypothetical protein